MGGTEANETLRAALGAPEGGSDNDRMVLRNTDDLEVLQETDFTAVVPRVYPEMVEALKFSAALPSALAIRTLGERLAGMEAATKVAAMPRLRRHGEPSWAR